MWPVVAFALTVFASGAAAENLSTAVSSALRIHPEILALRSNAMAAGYGLRASKGRMAPQISMSASATVSTDFEAEADNWNATLSATQSIYDGGLATSEISRASAEEKSLVSKLSDQSQVVSLEATLAYMEVQRSRGIVRIFESNLAGLKAIQAKVVARVNAGISGEVELYDTAAKIDAAILNLLDARVQLAEAVVNYTVLVGRTPAKLETVSSPVKFLPQGADEAVRLALHRSPKIMAVKYDALAADAVASGLRAANKPKIDLALTAGNRDAFSGGFDASQDLSAQVSFRFDLYDGGTNRARARQARYNADATRFRARQVARDVEREVRLSWNSIHISRDRIKALKSQVADTGKALRLSISRYEAGVTSLSQLLDLQSQHANARAAWLNYEFTYRYNVYRILAGTGRLTAALRMASNASMPSASVATK